MPPAFKPANTDKIVVLGATGNVGFATVNALSKKGIKVRAGVRDPTSEKAKQLASFGNVELVQSNFADVSTT